MFHFSLASDGASDKKGKGMFQYLLVARSPFLTLVSGPIAQISFQPGHFRSAIVGNLTRLG